MKKIILGTIVSLLISSNLMAVEQKVYAVVNGDKITSQSIAIALKDPRVQFDTLPKETQKNILNRVIEQKILAQNSMKTGVVNDPIYIETLKGLKQDLALQVWLQQQSSKINISQKDVKKYYNANKNLFSKKEQFHARHILVKTKKEASSIIKTLTKSSNLKAKFISLAKEKSTGPSGKSGGDLGFFTVDKMVPEFSNATSKLKVNTITKKPVKTQFGYHIIYLEDKKNASTVSFENAKLQIKQQLGQQQLIRDVQTMVNKLKKSATIIYK